jgi:hypothetical protein
MSHRELFCWALQMLGIDLKRKDWQLKFNVKIIYKILEEVIVISASDHASSNCF